MSQYNGSTGEDELRANVTRAHLEALLKQLVGPEGRATLGKPCNPPWVGPQPDVNPVYLEQLPPHLTEALETAQRGTPERLQALQSTVRYITSEVLSVIIEGGQKGVSARHLWWAWEDSGFGKYAKQGDIIFTLVAASLIDYDPTVKGDQQVVAIADPCAIEWVDTGD